MLPLSLAQLAERLDAELQGPRDLSIRGMCSVEEPQADCLGFAETAKQLRSLKPESMAAIIVAPNTKPNLAHLICEKPRVAFAKALAIFNPPHLLQAGIHPTAAISPLAEVSGQAEIGPFCVVGPDSKIEAGTRLVARVTVGAGALIGSDCQIYPGCVIDDGVVIGSGAVLDPNCRILRGAILGKDIYVGSRSILDGCTLEDGCKMDNLAYVGTDSLIGAHSLLISKSHIGRGVTTGPYFLIAAVSSVADNLTMASLVQVAGFSRVDRSWDTPKIQIAGDPAQEIKSELKERSLKLKVTRIYEETRQRRRP